MPNQEPGPMDNDSLLLIHDVCNAEQLKKLLKNGADINEINTFEETPLLSALRREADYELIKEFVIQGANVNAKDCWGVTPLYCAVARHGKDLDIIKLLLENGADIESGKRKNDRFLDHTVTHNRVCVELLIKYKFLKNFQNVKNCVSDAENNEKRDFYSEYKDVVDLDLKPSCYQFLSKYLDDCASEVIQMRSVFLSESLTLADFLTRKNPLESVSDPETFHQIINRIFVELSWNNMSKYHIYFDMIVTQLGRKNILKLLDDKLACSKSYISKLSKNKRAILNLDLMHVIAKYLNDVDLFNTLIACTL
ncbi:ANK_REP_REGION domain-containing protein [Nephila pilipes]|uniref:ANK_REP_REGION domain-containing protein n=1 Tax=Nephila pilipes TaxID=299642 RepID=A0A8X6JZU2_NEPPI|nr:ANK_REP_REGION domain-containing protein [Nephila pilipes]